MTYIQSIQSRFSAIPKLTKWLTFAALWLIVALFAWFQVVYQSPENVFKGMLRNNFATVGYTKDATSSQGEMVSQELTQLQLLSDPVVRGVTSLKQGGDSVVTNTLTTGSDTYVRYTKIDTDRKDENGKPLDFTKAVNVWAKGEARGGSADQAYGQLMLGLMPIGNMAANDRAELLKQIEQNEIFKVDYKNVKKHTKDGRLQYEYNVSIVPQPYIAMLKAFGESVGLASQVADLDPKNYQGQEPVAIKVTVDAKSRHLVTVGMDGQEAQTEKYTSFGIVKPVKIPTKHITTEELQQRLSVQ